MQRLDGDDEQDMPPFVSHVHLPIFVSPYFACVRLEKKPHSLSSLDTGFVGIPKVSDLGQHDMGLSPNLKMEADN